MSESTCMIFAHRGANKEAMENTRAAFNKALEYPIDGFETDVQLSFDEAPVLWHDWCLDKVGYPDKCVDDFTLAQLEQMNFARFFSSDAKPEGILSLKEFIGSFRGYCGLDIELKSPDGESRQRLEKKIHRIFDITGTSAIDGVFISSFSLSGLIFAHQCAPNFPLYYLLSDHHTQADIVRCLKDCNFLAGFCLPINIINDDITGLLRDNGKSIVVYTCNSVEDIQKALDLKVNILITDCPQLALQMRNK
jgi:glycerophosphoryl diester phosphodiesterase